MQNLIQGWHLTARYAYTLHLDGPALAWEYLRRNQSYQKDWEQCDQYPEAAKRWDLYFMEDPLLDAVEAQPAWLIDPDDLIRLTGHPGSAAAPFSIWDWPGHKRMTFDGKRFLFTVRVGTHDLRMALDETVYDGQPVAYLIPSDAHALTYLKAIERQRRLTESAPPPKPIAQARPNRISTMHMHCLQAIDGEFAGANHREIAEVLFGAERVSKEWGTDSELRVRIRHLLKRARDYKDGEYRRLLSKHASAVQGDFKKPPNLPL